MGNVSYSTDLSLDYLNPCALFVGHDSIKFLNVKTKKHKKGSQNNQIPFLAR